MTGNKADWKLQELCPINVNSEIVTFSAAPNRQYPVLLSAVYPFFFHPSLPLPSFPPQHHTRGVVSMANSGPDTNGSQFFIIYSKQPHLDMKYTTIGKWVSHYVIVMGGVVTKATTMVLVFSQWCSKWFFPHNRMIDGWETLDDLEKLPVHEKTYRPTTEIRIRRITIHANPLADWFKVLPVILYRVSLRGIYIWFSFNSKTNNKQQTNKQNKTFIISRRQNILIAELFVGEDKIDSLVPKLSPKMEGESLGTRPQNWLVATGWTNIQSKA